MYKRQPHALPKGRELIPAEFKDVGVLLLPLGEGWDGASMLGWGFYGGWYAPPATLSELLLLAGLLPTITPILLLLAWWQLCVLPTIFCIREG